MELRPIDFARNLLPARLKPRDNLVTERTRGGEALRPGVSYFLRNSGILTLRRYLIAVVSAIALTGCSEPIRHDDDLARKRAIEFAEVALVRRDFDKGYDLLSSGAKSHVPVEKFRETLLRLHPDGYPTRITATGYKPMFNERAIYVYLSGEASGKQFQYTITLEGTAASDYKVSIINRTL